MDFVSEGVFVLLALIIVPRFDPFLLGEKIKTQIFSIPTRDRGEQLFWGSQKPFFRREDYSRLRIYTLQISTFLGSQKPFFRREDYSRLRTLQISIQLHLFTKS